MLSGAAYYLFVLDNVEWVGDRLTSLDLEGAFVPSAAVYVSFLLLKLSYYTLRLACCCNDEKSLEEMRGSIRQSLLEIA